MKAINFKVENLHFEPSYYEWHLTDGDGNILHNMVDPAESLYTEDGDAMTEEQIIDLCADDLNAAEAVYSEGDEYNGIYLEDSLTASQIKAASEIMGKALYNFYFA